MTADDLVTAFIFTPIAAMWVLIVWATLRERQLARRQRCEHEFRTMSPSWIARHPHPIAGEYYRSKCRKCGRLSVHIHGPKPEWKP